MLRIGHLTETIKSVPLAVILLGMAPVVMVLLPWDFGSGVTGYRALMRVNSLPVTVLEFMFVLLAITRGFAPVPAILSLPPLAKVGLSMLAIGAVWTTAFVAVLPNMAVIGIIKFFAHVMFSLAFAHQLAAWTTEQRGHIWRAIGMGVVGYCLLWGVNIAFYDPVGNDWISLVPALTNIRWAGFFALASFCAGIGLLKANPDDRTNRPRLTVGIFFCTIGLVLALWTGTRAAVVSIFAVVLLSSLVLAVLRRQLFMLTLISTVIALPIAAALPVVHPAYGIERMIGASLPTTVGADISSGRLEIWGDILDKVMRRPIMGWGIDQLRHSFPEGTPTVRNAHHGILQLLFSAGLWGMLATLLIAIPFVRKTPRTFTHPYQFASVAYLLGALTYGLYDGFFYFTYPVMILLVAAACVIAPKALPPATDTSGLPDPTG